MNIVITMAGLGSRFKKAGYSVPKYRIEAHGKSLFEWSISSLKGLNSSDAKYIFIVRKEDNASEFISYECSRLSIENFNIIEIDYVTDGQATTALLANEYWDRELPLMIYNIDTHVKPFEIKESDLCGDGFIPCFKAEGEQWSFVKLDKDEKAVEVREKQKISDNCTIGAYYFKSSKLYEDLYNKYYSDNSNLEKGEKYVAPLYNCLIENGGEVRISSIDVDKVHVLGTPEELDSFIECNYTV